MPHHPERVPPKATRFDRRLTLFNFVMADEYITRLDDPAVSLASKQRIVEEICVCEGMIKRAQQAELRRALTDLHARMTENPALCQQIEDALATVEQVSFVD